MNRLAAAAALTLASFALAAPAFANGHESDPVCHPKEGGWVLINPDRASSHIDEVTGLPKHEHDGRVDVYAINGQCPPLTTPPPTTTGSTPSATTTATSSPSPSTTSSTPTKTTTSPQPSSASSTSGPPKTSRTTTSASTKPFKPTSASPRSSAPSSTDAPPELAFTGADFGLLGLGVAGLGVGVALTATSRRMQGGRH